MREARTACVLVADDDPTANLLAQAALANAGFDPVCVPDGSRALERFRAGGIDLVVLDVEMPVLDGFGACRAIRSSPNGLHTPILMVTGRDDLASIEQAYEAGANDFVTKPVTWPIFCQRIRYMLRASEAFTRIRESQKAAEAANAAKRLFLARASHELRTPLHTILGFLEVLEPALGTSTGAGGATPGESIRVIHRSAQHLLRLVDDLLDISKIEAGKLRLELAPFVLAELLEDVRASLLPSARRQQVELRTRVDERVGLLASDAARVRQILTNLAVNAIRCSPGGNVELLATASESDGVEIEVRDDGTGMSPEQLQQAFEPFTQGEDPSTHGNAGLGLTLVRELTRALGGSLSASSEPGFGTVVRVRLPGLAPTNAKPDAGTAPRPAAGGDVDGLRSRRVLVVDDGRDNRRLLEVVLRKAGVEVALACDGREAVARGLEALRAGEPFDVLLMDLQMPHLDGLQAMQELRRNGYARPIVALTANAVEGERERSLAAGFDGFLTKPLGPGDLLREVAAWTAKTRDTWR